MGFLKKFFTNVFHENAPQTHGSSFEQLSPEQLEDHMAVRQYGEFELTDAIRPSFDLKVVPRQGYRHDVYRDEESGTEMPVIMASASRPILFELFTELVLPLGNVVDVVLETSHACAQGGHTDLYREHMDQPVLMSSLWDFEDLLTHDGCTGIAVLNPHIPQEIQFDEHKLLIVYGHDLHEYERIMKRFGVEPDEELKLITEAEHVHSSSDSFSEGFQELRMRLGMDNDSPDHDSVGF